MKNIIYIATLCFTLACYINNSNPIKKLILVCFSAKVFFSFIYYFFLLLFLWHCKVKNFSFSSIFLHLFKELMLNWNPVIWFMKTISIYDSLLVLGRGIGQDKITGKQICMLLCEQQVVDIPAEDEEALYSGRSEEHTSELQSQR